MLLAPLLAAASAALLPLAPVPPAAQFKDWSVACDNTRRCEAVAAVEADETGDNWVIHVVRGAAADAVPVVEATSIFGDPVAAVRVLVDGKAAPFGFDADGLLTGDPAAFLAALARARKVQVVAQGGAVIGTLPTSGASAGLRWIDDRQKRAGTVTALVARGSTAASAVPAVPPPPRIAQPPVSASPPRVLRRARRMPGCPAGNVDDALADRERAARGTRLGADFTGSARRVLVLGPSWCINAAMHQRRAEHEASDNVGRDRGAVCCAGLG